MKISPDSRNPQKFVLSDVSSQELANFVEMVKKTDWSITPWGKGIIERFEKAIADSIKFFSNTSW